MAARVALPRGAYGSLSAGRGGVVVASLILLLLSGIIALVIGLTGPDLASTAPPGLLLDLGSAPDLSPSALAAPTSSAAIDAAGFALSASAADSSPPSSPAQQEQKEQKEPTAGPLGQLKVISSPPNATVYLDGSRQCQTPCIVEELQRKQVYLLSVRRSGYTSWSSLVTIGEKRALPITVYLQEELVGKPIGFLLIRSRPRADVYLNGKEIGRVTSEGRIPMLPGRYVVTLSHPRKRRRPQYTVVIKPGRIVTLRSRF